MSFVSPGMKVRARDFSRGFSDSPQEDSLHPGATPNARNAFLTRIQLDVADGQRRAELSKRAGSRLINPLAIAAGAKVDGLFEVLREGATGELVASCNGSLVKFDGVDEFTAIAGGTGFTVGRTTRAAFQKNQAWIADGDKTVLYDGTSCRPPGFDAPTSVTNMSAVAPVGAGTTGTYTAVYTWYDQAHDHHSSITQANTTALVTAAQARRHTKPGGAPPANVTHWGIWVKRTDTNENYWFFCVIVPIATATYDEEQTDAQRRTKSPTYTSNNAPPVFNVIGFRYGYALGVKRDSSDIYVGKQGDLESFDPSDILSVGKGDGKPVRSIRPFGNDTIVQKPHKSFKLTGTKMPFLVDDAHSSFGAVSQESGVEINGQLYQWDEVRGPYTTDLTNWQALGDTKIAETLKSINKNALEDIRCGHDETNNLVLWLVPTIGSARKRTLLAYHYILNVFLPPITGLEYGSLTQFLDGSGTLGMYIGDYWGRIYKLFDGGREGVPSGSVTATVTSAAADSVTASAAAFYTDGSGLAGMPVAVKSPAGVWQWRRIASNTATQITIDVTNDSPWTTVPAADWQIVVGGIQWEWWTPVLDMDAPEVKKRAHWMEIQGKASSVRHEIEVNLRFNDDVTNTEGRTFAFTPGSGAGIWGSMVWGVSLWGTSERRMRKKRIGRVFFSMQAQFRNYYPDQPIAITLYQVGADPLKRRRESSA